MLGRALERVARFVTDHNRVVVLAMLVLTAGVAVGATDLNTDVDSSDSDAIGDTTVAQKQDYVRANYLERGDQRDAPDLNESQIDRLVRTGTKRVYVRDRDGNVLSKPSLLRTLLFRKGLRQDPAVDDLLSGRGEVDGVASAVARRAAGDRNASLDAQVDALENASSERVRALVAETLSEGSPLLEAMPNDYEPGSTTAESRAMRFRLVAADDTSRAAARAKLERVDRLLYERARSVSDPDYFTVGEHALDRASAEQTDNTFELVVPFALVVILAVLAFVYRDLVDIVVGFAGVVVSVLWMYGILGWLQVPANAAIVVGPVLIVGLSVDYGLHVFTRYREQRGTGADPDDGIRESMARSLRRVGVALALVTATTAVGFAANVTNEFSSIRGLAIGISLGVVSSFVVFVTLVPALKVGIDGLLERVGLDRRKRPLGEGRLIRPLLSGGVRVATAAAPVVLVVALVAGAAGGLAWSNLERQGFQERTGDVAEWKTELPDPVGWEEPAGYRHREFVDDAYRTAAASEYDDSQILVQGPVTDPRTLDRLQAAHRELRNSTVLYRTGAATGGPGTSGGADATGGRSATDGPERAGSRATARPSIRSPLTGIRALAARDASVRQVVRETDTDGDGVPDGNLTRVYDAVYAAAPDRASRVLERENGRYRSLRLVVLVEESATLDRRTDRLQSVAATIEGDTGLRATAIGQGPLVEAESIQTAESILETLLLALAAVFVMLVVVYRLAEGSASLGAVTVLPIALVTAYLVGAMYLLSIPLTVVTALLMSLVVGLGIDYSIHVSDRFAQELDDGAGPVAALERAVTGTGGALLGSTLTSAGAFTAILLHPSPQIQSFGKLVVLALVLSFFVSVYVLPSLLVLWHRHVRERGAAVESRLTGAGSDD